MMIRRLALAALALFLMVAVGTAAAHGYIVRSIPEDRATLERAPARAQYWFSEALEPTYSALTVRDAEGRTVATGGVSDKDRSLLEARLPSSLPDGAYIAELRVAFASDGHVVVESRVFFVGKAVEGVAGVAASSAADPLEVVWRAVVLASLTLLFGVFSLYAVVLVPAWGNPGYRAGLLPPRVMRRLNGIVAVALVAALLGNLLALLQQTMVFFDADAGRVLSQGLWSVVRIGTNFGDVWNARMVFLALAALLFVGGLYFRERQPETVRAFWIGNVWLSALVLATLSVGSHAAGSRVLPWIGIGAEWVHALAVGFWAGGLAALVLVLPAALAPYAGDDRRRALIAALGRFSRVAVASVAVVVTSGIYLASNWLYTPGDLGTTYGGALVFKLILVAALLLVGLAHHMALRPERYARWSALWGRVRALVPTLRLEVVLALAVLIAAGLLSATPPPIPAFAANAPPALSASRQVGDLSVSATVSPGGPGVNSYDLVVTQDGKPVDGATVRARLVSPSTDWRGGWHETTGSGDGLYVATGDDVSAPGEWWMLVDVGATRFAFDWTINADAAVTQTLPPNAFQAAALIGVLAGLIFAAWPRLMRFYRRLDLRPAFVTVAVGAMVGAAVLIGAGYLLMQQSLAQFDATTNPPPILVNSTLPDAASLERGHALLAEACPAWLAVDNRDVAEFVRRLSRTRDEAIFTATQKGWRDLPACTLTDAQRWDAVNYLRSLESFSDETETG